MVNTESYNKATERFIDAGGFIRTNLSLVQATTPYVPVLTNQLDSFIMAVPGTMVVFLFDFIELLLLLLLSIPVVRSITWIDMESHQKRPENLTVVEDNVLEVQLDMSSWSWSIESLFIIVNCKQQIDNVQC